MTPEIDAASEAFINKYAANVTELRFGKTIKVCKRHAFMNRPEGWHLLVEGPVGGHIMSAADGLLYRTTDPDADPMRNSSFVFDTVVDAITWARALEDNLGDAGKVVDPSRSFISRYLNPTNFQTQSNYWASEDGGIGEVLAR